MKGLQLFFFFNFFLILFLRETLADQSKSNGVYIVYMGATRWPNGAQRKDHMQLITSLMTRKNNTVLHTYSNGFLGFAARLSEEEAMSIAKKPGVVSVFPDSVLKLHTTRSWDFLQQQESALEAVSAVSTPRSSTNDPSTNGADTIIGFLDSGIWPESESFNDVGLGPIPSRWKGKCMEGKNFTAAKCNRKIIGARYYKGLDTPRDDEGHGTHVASTAAGTPVPGASYYGLANGTARGGSPGSRIAMYRVCMCGGCSGSAIMKAFDDAIGDGVDVLSLSLGSGYQQTDFSVDPIAIGAFHAMEKGIVVACSAGNSGLYPQTVENIAPWIITVGATTIDRDLQGNVVLGGGKVIEGGGINFSNLRKSPVYPLIDGLSAKSNSSQAHKDSARFCDPDSLDPDKVMGKILLCEASGIRTFEELRDRFGAIGMITISDNGRQMADAFRDYPISAVSEKDGAQILSYIKSNRDPVATILPTKVVPNYKPAPVVAIFSSKGPISSIRSLTKPDIMAPGVNILAAWAKIKDEYTLPGKDPSPFVIISGTSMSCPHVAGLAATIKSQHPAWSPAAIRSAIMTTAIQADNLHSAITNFTGSSATPYDIGAGEISLSAPLEPGLVYETEKMDYVLFLCNAGYNTTTIKMIASDVPVNFSCPVDSRSDLISNTNYPSIAVSMKENEIRTVSRMVTNVGEDESSYIAGVEEPAGVSVQVVPGTLEFTKYVKELEFQVIFEMTEGSEKELFGSITWYSKKYQVRSPFVVSNAGQES